jgi:hypothetical protein
VSRHAAALSELLWANRDRLLQSKPVRGLRQVDIARSTDQEKRVRPANHVAARGGCQPAE